MPFDKMPFDKMQFDKMQFDKMQFDKMLFDQMSFTKHHLCHVLYNCEIAQPAARGRSSNVGSRNISLCVHWNQYY